MPPKRKASEKASEKITETSITGGRNKKQPTKSESAKEEAKESAEQVPIDTDSEVPLAPQDKQTPAEKKRRKESDTDESDPHKKSASQPQETKSRDLNGAKKRGQKKSQKETLKTAERAKKDKSSNVSNHVNESQHDSDQMTIDDFLEVEPQNERSEHQKEEELKENFSGTAEEKTRGKHLANHITNTNNQIAETARKELPPNVLEMGHISFFYRPKIGAMHPDSPDDIQRLYVMLLPTLVKPTLADEVMEAAAQRMEKGKPVEDQKALGLPRLMIIGRKKLPEVGSRARYWAFVEKVFRNLEDVKDILGEEHYSTVTRGERTLQPCRPLGRGVYSILEHHNHSHLAYVLELPKEPGAIQQAFNIKHEASYIITVKNPETSNPGYAGLSKEQKPAFPDYLVQTFQGRRFMPISTTEYLDYEHSEVILIGAAEDIIGELREAGENLEEIAEEETKEIAPLGPHVIFDELRLYKGQLPTEPLRGLWK